MSRVDTRVAHGPFAGLLVIAMTFFSSSQLRGDGLEQLFGKPATGAPELPESDCGSNYDEKQRAADFDVQGEFAGRLRAEAGAHDFGAQVVALGCARFHLVLYPGGLPGAGWRKSAGLHRVNGGLIGRETSEQAVQFEHPSGWRAAVSGRTLVLRTKEGTLLGTLERVVRRSPTVGLKPPEGAVVLFDGSSAEQFLNARVDAEKRLIPGGPTRRPFGDCTLHLEFLIPFAPQLRGQGRCNSGVHMQGRYEVQILDSFGLGGLKNECGGVYRIAGPEINMSFPPRAWQTYDIDFTAPCFDADGFKMHNALMTIRHNGVVIHDRLNVYRTTASDSPPEAPGPHPLSLQARDPVVLFRNIWIVERIAEKRAVPLPRECRGSDGEKEEHRDHK